MTNKTIRYYEPAQLEQLRTKTELKLKNHQARILLNEKRIQNLMNEDLKKHVRQIVKLSDEVQKLKIKSSRLNNLLEEIKTGKVEVISPIKKAKQAFSNIPYRKQKYLWGILFSLPWMIGMAVFFLPSFLKSVWWSFNNVVPTSNGLQVTFVGIQNYIELFRSYVIDGNTVFSVELYLFVQNLVIDLPIILIFSILIAVFLNKPFKGHKLVKAIFFIPVIYNITLITDTLSKGFGQYIDDSTGTSQMFVQQITSFFMEIGLGQSLMGIVLNAIDRIFMIVNLSGIQILIFIAAIQAIPNQLYEAAKMEGATKYEIFWKITMAMITPLILTAAVFTVVDSFTRAPIYRFLDFAMTQNRYGLAATISISYFAINVAIIGIVFLLMKGRVFYYDDRK
ncbi:sugar ABC transporter permease [Acholeplasma vituli]|uniref:Sugar ABC transporter permease n=1 Tax=Paracholeplasma vituli TaxID=69473 RepID=A0ABT2PTK2_9MOLU|nr:sugar ABC transporter permease [Paracholeplasma vituli]MCU0104276.1 sugar ABC transporter permease [Paracholeplasma vituli]